MPKINIFDKPFDEGTIAKLDIFEKYLDSWLPTFIMSDFKRPIQLFDLFAGAGRDNTNVEGSPLRILRVISKYGAIIRNNNAIINIFFNDLDENNILSLIEHCRSVIRDNKINDIIKISYSSKPFIDFLKTNGKLLEKGCNLIFLDQNGFKQVTKSVFQFLINLESTEFIFFISSSHIHRFANEPEVQKHLPGFDFNKIKMSSRKVIHNVICQEFEKYVPDTIKSYSLIPFSIMKSDKNNVYGLIFVSKHVRGADKFLDVVWKMNHINGNANYDIDGDSLKVQQNLFLGQLPTKIEAFQNKLKELILNKKLLNNLDVYVYTLNEGHIPKHAYPILVEMKKRKLIDYNSKSPLINYIQIFKNNRIIDFNIL